MYQKWPLYDAQTAG